MAKRQHGRSSARSQRRRRTPPLSAALSAGALTAAAFVATANAAAAEEPAEQSVTVEPLSGAVAESALAASAAADEVGPATPAPESSATEPVPANTTAAELLPPPAPVAAEPAATDANAEPAPQDGAQPPPAAKAPEPVAEAAATTATPAATEPVAPPAATTAPTASPATDAGATASTADVVVPASIAYYGYGKVTVDSATGFYPAGTTVPGADVTVTDTTNSQRGTCTTGIDGTCSTLSQPPLLQLDSPADSWVVTQDSAPDGFGRVLTSTGMTQDGDGCPSSLYVHCYEATLTDAVPQVKDDMAAGPQNSPIDIDVLFNDEAYGATLEVRLESDDVPPSHGTVVLVGCPPGPCTVRYTPVLGYVGDDEFTYTAGIRAPLPPPPTGPQAVGIVSPDAAADPYFFGQASARVRMTLEDIPPTAGDTNAVTPYGEPISVGVLKLASAAAGNSITVSDTSTSESGTVTLNADDSVTYTPASGFSGADSFTYTVSDGKGGSATGTVWVMVGPGPVQSPIVQTPRSTSYVVVSSTAPAAYPAELPRTGLSAAELLDLSLALLGGGMLMVGAGAVSRRRTGEAE